MASSSGHDSLRRAATLVAWLMGSVAALAQPGVDGSSHGGPGHQGGPSMGGSAMGGSSMAGPSAGDMPSDGREPPAGSRGASAGAEAGSGGVVTAEQVSSGVTRAATADGTGGGRYADQELARAAMARGELLPLDRILKKATDFVPGDVLEVRLRGRPNASWVYEIRMLSDDGRIRMVVVDATRNTVLEVRRP